MARPALTFARFVATPETRAAWCAVRDVADGTHSLVFLHGPPGAGKSHLVHALAGEVAHQRPTCVVALLQASELARPEQGNLFDDDAKSPKPATADWLADAR